jgi:hypothetical protein
MLVSRNASGFAAVIAAALWTSALSAGLAPEDVSALVVLEPPVQAGQTLVRNGEEMWLYLPRSGKITRIGAKESSMGGEVSNADLLRADLSKDYDGTWVAEETVEGIRCHKLELREFYSLSGRRLKTMIFRDLKKFGGKEVPARASRTGCSTPST